MVRTIIRQITRVMKNENLSVKTIPLNEENGGPAEPVKKTLTRARTDPDKGHMTDEGGLCPILENTHDKYDQCRCNKNHLR